MGIFSKDDTPSARATERAASTRALRKALAIKLSWLPVSVIVACQPVVFDGQGDGTRSAAAFGDDAEPCSALTGGILHPGDEVRCLVSDAAEGQTVEFPMRFGAKYNPLNALEVTARGRSAEVNYANPSFGEVFMDPVASAALGDFWERNVYIPGGGGPSDGWATVPVSLSVRGANRVLLELSVPQDPTRRYPSASVASEEETMAPYRAGRELKAGAPLSSPLELSWSIDGRQLPSLCWEHGISRWKVEIGFTLVTPQKRVYYHDCRRRGHWDTVQYSFPPGRTTVTVQALGDRDDVVAEETLRFPMPEGRPWRLERCLFDHVKCQLVKRLDCDKTNCQQAIDNYREWDFVYVKPIKKAFDIASETILPPRSR